MTTFSFYKPEGQSSCLLHVSVENTENLDQSPKDLQMKAESVPGPSFARKVLDPEAFYNLMATYTGRIVQEARSSWNQMSYRQRSRFGPVRWRRIIRVQSKSVKEAKARLKLARKWPKRNTDKEVKIL